MVTRTMTIEEHVQKAYKYLEDGDREFVSGDDMQASEKMWGAACQAAIAMSKHRGWRATSHRAMKNAVQRLANELDDPLLEAQFATAEKFHANFYHGFMDDFEIQGDRPLVRNLVVRVVALLP